MDEVAKCFSCGKEHEILAMAPILGGYEMVNGKFNRHGVRYFCDECAREKLAKCDLCTKTMVREEMEVARMGNQEYLLCDTCTNVHTFICNKCGGRFLNDDSHVVGGKYVCTPCRRKYATCSMCGELEIESEMGRYDISDRICRTCMKRAEVTFCESCNMYQDTDSFEKIEGRNVCYRCITKFLEQAAGAKISDADVYKAFPLLDKRIGMVFERSARNRSIDASHAMDALVEMQGIIGVTIDRKTRTYSDQHGSGKKLTELKSERNSHFKQLGRVYQEDLRKLVDAISNNERDLKDLQEELALTIEKAIVAIKVRWYRESFSPRVKEETGKLEGDYPATFHSAYFDDGTLRFYITKDPAALIAKSTSQCWEGKSCEKVIRGDFGEGPFSDIANSNLICYLINTANNNFPLARIMIRWCESDAGYIDFGIEKKWYYCVYLPEGTTKFSTMGSADKILTTQNRVLGTDITMKKMTVALISLLKSRGYMQYSSCTTPYAYGGYSDTKSGARVKIRYRQRDYVEYE